MIFYEWILNVTQSKKREKKRSSHDFFFNFFLVFFFVLFLPYILLFYVQFDLVMCSSSLCNTCKAIALLLKWPQNRQSFTTFYFSNEIHSKDKLTLSCSVSDELTFWCPGFWWNDLDSWCFWFFLVALVCSDPYLRVSGKFPCFMGFSAAWWS